jgi:hypothetical protein
MTPPTVIWTTAKTYAAIAPHEYCAQGKVPPAFFEFYANKIREQGVNEQFSLRGRTSTYKYWHSPDGYRYWRIGRILNRARTGHNQSP